MNLILTVIQTEQLLKTFKSIKEIRVNKKLFKNIWYTVVIVLEIEPQILHNKKWKNKIMFSCV